LEARAKNIATSKRNDTLVDHWAVYILRCSDGTLYTGIAKDLTKRLAQHNAGKASKYTRSRLPVELEYQEFQRDQSSALKRELAIKALSRQAKESLIQSNEKSA